MGVRVSARPLETQGGSRVSKKPRVPSLAPSLGRAAYHAVCGVLGPVAVAIPHWDGDDREGTNVSTFLHLSRCSADYSVCRSEGPFLHPLPPPSSNSFLTPITRYSIFTIAREQLLSTPPILQTRNLKPQSCLVWPANEWGAGGLGARSPDTAI